MSEPFLILHWTEYLQMQVLVVEDLHDINIKLKKQGNIFAKYQVQKEKFWSSHIYDYRTEPEEKV